MAHRHQLVPLAERNGWTLGVDGRGSPPLQGGGRQGAGGLRTRLHGWLRRAAASSTAAEMDHRIAPRTRKPCGTLVGDARRASVRLTAGIFRWSPPCGGTQTRLQCIVRRLRITLQHINMIELYAVINGP